MGTNRPAPIAVIAALIVAFAAAIYAWNYGRNAGGLDFYQFRAGAQVARDKSTINLYSGLTRHSAHEKLLQTAGAESPKLLEIARSRTELELYSTPFLYSTFGLFRGNYDRDLVAFQVVSLGAFIAGVLLSARAVGMGWAPALMLLAFTLTLFQPLKSEIRVTNVNSIQLAGVAGAIYLLRSNSPARSVAAAAILGLLLTFKPNTALVIPLLLFYRLMTRDRRRLLLDAGGLLAGTIAGIVVGSLYFGTADAWIQWLAAAKELAATRLSLEAGNIAPAESLLGLGSGVVTIVRLAICLIVAYVLYRGRNRDENVLVVGVGLLVYFLTAGLVWIHYLVLALPLIVVLLCDWSMARRMVGILSLTLIGADIWTAVLNVRTIKGEAVEVWLGLALLFSATLWRLVDRGGAAETPGVQPARSLAARRHV